MLLYLFEIKSILTDGFVKFIWILHILYKKKCLADFDVWVEQIKQLS